VNNLTVNTGHYRRYLLYADRKVAKTINDYLKITIAKDNHPDYCYPAIIFDFSQPLVNNFIVPVDFLLTLLVGHQMRCQILWEIFIA